MNPNNIITFIFADPRNGDFTKTIYDLRNFMKKANGVVLHEVSTFFTILEFANSDFRFRLIIHSGIGDSDNVQSSGSSGMNFLGELTANQHLNNIKIPFITRRKEIFIVEEQKTKNETAIQLVKGYTYLNANLINDLSHVDSMISEIPILRKGDLINTTSISGYKSTDSGEINGVEGYDFAIQTALYEHEYQVYNDYCAKISSGKINNSHIVKFKENKKLAYGEDYEKEFLIVHQEKMGLVHAAIHSTQTIVQIDPSFLILSGVCGGKKGVANILDVIIPTTVYDYATGKFKEGRFESLGYETSTNVKLIEYLQIKQNEIIHNMRSLIDSSRKELLGKDFKIIFDEFACGPWVVKTEGFLDDYLIDNVSKKIKGLEMESYSILRTGELIQRPKRFSLVVKSVMDHTNEYKNDGEKGTLKASAAYISYLCVRAMMPLLLEFKNNSDKWQK